MYDEEEDDATERIGGVIKVLIAPHPDDETLFAAYTILRLKPLVLIVTDDDRGKVSAETRRQESRQAMKILGVDVRFLGIPESKLNLDVLKDRLHRYRHALAFIPAKQGGHPHHDIVADCMEDAIHYATYTKENLTPEGNVEVIPTNEEVRLKNLALDCYKSQFPWNKAHFDAVRNRSEWYVL